jgi:hypothetical protein
MGIYSVRKRDAARGAKCMLVHSKCIVCNQIGRFRVDCDWDIRKMGSLLKNAWQADAIILRIPVSSFGVNDRKSHCSHLGNDVLSLSSVTVQMILNQRINKVICYHIVICWCKVVHEYFYEVL